MLTLSYGYVSTWGGTEASCPQATSAWQPWNWISQASDVPASEGELRPNCRRPPVLSPQDHLFGAWECAFQMPLLKVEMVLMAEVFSLGSFIKAATF